ncbi:hypothetical protein H0H93_008287 [Arthromyces matolae]|nr:hypothetical protein H0H93_008287 [Arthromyces matolae]
MMSPPLPDTPPKPSSKTADTTATSDGLLTLVLLGQDWSEDRHALVLFSKTYEDAISAAIKAFGVYIPRNQYYQSIQLHRALRNRNGEWIWARIQPGQWAAMVPIDSTEIGVALAAPPRILPTTFLHGRVHFVYTLDEGHGIKWPNFPTRFTEPPEFRHIIQHEGGVERLELDDAVLDRPESYNDAVNSVRAIFASRGRALGDNDSLTFCAFPYQNSLTWIPLPDEVRTDVALWQALLPPTGHLLGLIIKRNESGYDSTEM